MTTQQVNMAVQCCYMSVPYPHEYRERPKEARCSLRNTYRYLTPFILRNTLKKKKKTYS